VLNLAVWFDKCSYLASKGAIKATVGLGQFVREWRALGQFKALEVHARSIVFYAEDAGAWRCFEPIISELVGTHGKQICYVTSSPNDPVLRMKDRQIQTFCIGFSIVRTLFFLSLRAVVMVMTMSDLETYHLKRSKHPVHYVYVYHSINSSHMAYRQGAFDHFDSILCVGPHHQDEIRAAEQLYSLAPKTLVAAGYGIVDSILHSDEPTIGGAPPADGPGKRVLIAPTWGKDSLLETRGPELVEILLRAGYRVTVRPHTMTIRQRPKLLNELRKRFTANTHFHLDLDLTSQGTVHASDIMISDWSGAALDYAFGLERPVLFVDVPRKVNNPEYEKIPFVPIEVKLRTEVGEIVSPDRLSNVPSMIDRLCQNTDDWRERIREMRTRWIYNVGTSGKVAASYIARVAETAAASGVES